MIILDNPVRFHPDLVHQAALDWPTDDWCHWIHYDSDDQKKRTCNVPVFMPDSIKTILRGMLTLPVQDVLEGVEGPLIADPGLYAGGMHSMAPAEYVRTHLDCDGHPLMPWTRRVNVMLYLGDCDGGELVLHHDDRKTNIKPRSGRLVLFECSDSSFHSVTKVESGCRKSLMVCFWDESTREDKRPKAQFV